MIEITNGRLIRHNPSASELFGGLYQKVEHEVTERAKKLAEKGDQEKLIRLVFTNIANKFLN